MELLELWTTLAESPVSADLLELLRADGYDVDLITIDKLLSHSSGIFDYAHGHGSRYITEVLADPHRVWTREDRVRSAVDYGDPISVGLGFYNYSETNYVLLEDIVERAYDAAALPR